MRSPDLKSKNVSAQGMKAIDRRTIEEFGIPSIVLMENAGRETSQVAIGMLNGKAQKKVAIFCGRGNNGGDGLVAARYLINHGMDVGVYLVGREKRLKGAPLINLHILFKMGQKVERIIDLKDLLKLKKKIRGSYLIIDAILGIGLSGELRGILKELVDFLNSFKKPILSIDVPSGLDATTGKIRGAAIRAHSTVTFGLAKKGFFLRHGPSHVGRLIVAEIGIPHSLL